MSQVLSITSQPASNDIVSVYRPVLFTINVSDTQPPQVVYCDVYVNGVYYRTLTKTLYKTLNSGSSDWEFDVQDPCQEVLTKFLPPYGDSDINIGASSSATIQCKFRGSTIDADGFLVPGATAPVQGTATIEPISGTGLESNEFYILNVALQHYHNQVLSSHLAAYKNGTWVSTAFPMSHRINGYVIGVDQNDFFPIFYKGTNALTSLKIYYRNKGQVTWFNQTHTVGIAGGTLTPFHASYEIVNNGDGTQTVTFTWDDLGGIAGSASIGYDNGTFASSTGGAVSPQSVTIPLDTYTYSVVFHFVDGSNFLLTFPFAETEVTVNMPQLTKSSGVCHIPNGPKNLASLFPSITWRNLAEYYVQVIDNTAAVVATSPINALQEWSNDEHERIYFLNDCGTYDGVNFLKPNAVIEDSSSEFQTSVGSPLSKSDFSSNRFNVRSNETREVKRKSQEQEMNWLSECKRTIQAYIDWIGTEGQSDDYMSIVVLNGKIETIKPVSDYEYDFVLQFKLSNELFSIRN